jgi:hypothetical protein
MLTHPNEPHLTPHICQLSEHIGLFSLRMLCGMVRCTLAANLNWMHLARHYFISCIVWNINQELANVSMTPDEGFATLLQFWNDSKNLRKFLYDGDRNG